MLNAYPSGTQGWVAYFESNSSRETRLPFDTPNDHHLQPLLREALVRTLQRFNLGESGEGEYLKRFAASTGDSTYCKAIDLFVAEEQTHSRWFEMLLERMEAPTLETHWSDSIFTSLRRSGGLHFELLTFLTAEIVAQKFFSQLARNCPESTCSAVFSQVVRDESAHIAFHIGTLQHAFAKRGPLYRRRLYIQWTLMLGCATAIVCLDQAPIFRQLGLSRRDFIKGCFTTLEVVEKRVWKRTNARASMITPRTGLPLRK